MNTSERLRMLRGIPRHYYYRKGELTLGIEEAVKLGGIVYRTALICECTDCGNYRTTGAVVISPVTCEVISYLIRCRSCAREKGGEDGTL